MFFETFFAFVIIKEKFHVLTFFLGDWIKHNAESKAVILEIVILRNAAYLPPRNGYLPIMNIISIQAKHTAAEATTLRTYEFNMIIVSYFWESITSKFAINSIEVNARENMSNLNQLSNSKKYLLPKAANSHNCWRNKILKY